jgi:preprotein translocase subunit SecE
MAAGATMASKKKGKRRARRITDSKRDLAEAPDSGIEPGQALDEAESLEKTTEPKKAVKAPQAEKKIEKVAKKPPPKGPGVWAKMRKFFKDVHAEAKKVVWPDPEQQKNSTTVVVVTIVVLAGFMGFFSNVFYRISDRVFLPDTNPPPAVEQPGLEGVEDEGEGEEGGGGEAGGGAPVDAEGTS